MNRKKWLEYLKESGYYSEEEIQKMLEEEERLEKLREEDKRRRKERSDKIRATHALHKRLVDLGAKWLLKHSPTKEIYCSHSGIIVTEIKSYTNESPDILGFAHDDKTVLLEAKISRADFKGDSKKFFRVKPEYGMGDFRSFITPKGLIKPEELPEKWGLIEVDEKDRIKIIKHAERQEANKKAEHIVLKSIIKRIGQNPPEGVSIKCYVYETKNNTTLLINRSDDDS